MCALFLYGCDQQPKVEPESQTLIDEHSQYGQAALRAGDAESDLFGDGLMDTGPYGEYTQRKEYWYASLPVPLDLQGQISDTRQELKSLQRKQELDIASAEDKTRLKTLTDRLQDLQRFIDANPAGETDVNSVRMGYLKACVGNFNNQHYKDGYAECYKAASAGSTPAQYYLGRLLMDGLGTRKSNSEAYKWLILSAAGDVAPAKVLKLQLTKRLTPIERQQGEALALKWEPESLTPKPVIPKRPATPRLAPPAVTAHPTVHATPALPPNPIAPTIPVPVTSPEHE